MSRVLLIVAAGAAGAFFALPAGAQSWINYTNQTSTRLNVATGLGATDPEEKDFAYADFDHDGDIDLVIVRKTPFTTIGPRRNVLLMNEGIAQGQTVDGVLVDRSTQYASAADDGGQGFLDATDDRDVVAVDVNGDGWVDLVTATTYGQALPKTLSHPRVYINLGSSGSGWLGFRYEQARIPTLPGAPNFCAVGAGDVTGDKLPDLYFVDYDNIASSPFDDRLLVNDGNGYFTDQSTTRLTAAMLDSGFGTTANIVDMNGDGKLDIVKSENGPVKTHYNNGGGFFTSMQNTYGGAAYFASVGDLNNDGKYDILISDDGTDVYMLNTGNGGNGQAVFSNKAFPANSGGFGSVSRTVDLNNDGKNDTLVCPNDVDIPGCGGQMHIYRNLGNFPSPSLVDQGTGGIPASSLSGVFDCAVFDLNGDGLKDLVLGRCSGLEVWVATPPSGLVFDYPVGLPSFLVSNQPTTFQVEVNGVGGATLQSGTPTLFYSINGAAFTSVILTPISGNLYSATLPAVQCTDIIVFYFTAKTTANVTFRDPVVAPIQANYSAISGQGTEITLDEHFEAGVAAWNVTNHASLTGGAWQQADPNQTLNAGQTASPEFDGGNGTDVQAFVTQNGAPGGAANVADVDNGPTWLTSPVIDLAGTDATIVYSRWFYCEDVGAADADFLFTEVSNNNGASWVPVHNTGSTGGAWESTNFRVGEFVTPTAQVRVRFWTQDAPNNSITEAGIDNFKVERLICALPCLADVATPHDQTVNIDDLLAVINAWGPCANPNDCPADIAPAGGNDAVDIDDLLAVINAWGACP